jgi:hypothetical protein
MYLPTCGKIFKPICIVYYSVILCFNMSKVEKKVFFCLFIYRQYVGNGGFYVTLIHVYRMYIKYVIDL